MAKEYCDWKLLKNVLLFCADHARPSVVQDAAKDGLAAMKRLKKKYKPKKQTKNINVVKPWYNDDLRDNDDFRESNDYARGM